MNFSLFYRNNINVLLLLLFLPVLIFSQARVKLNNQDIFCNGANVGWISFSRDLGPSVSTTSFKNYFQQFSASGGNTVRVWLHTTGQYTPVFDANGNVTGPGTIALSNLKDLLDAAWEYKIGLMLCLWSFDMQRSTLSAANLANTKKILLDSTATRTYINNALIPMVQHVKGHPAILCWEVFNEPEGMSIEFGWSSITTCQIPMFNIQRFVNKIAGAIHRVDPNAKVTNGAWSFYAATDMNYASKQVPVELNKLSIPEQEKIREQINEKYSAKLTIDQIQEDFVDKTAALANMNYYRDDRLIQAGGDQKGTLDFYCVHYYASNFGTGLSPFHHPYSDWGLDKPLVVAEFYPEDSRGVPYQQLYKKLFETGYAGAMTWGWDNTGYNSKTRELMANLLSLYPYDIAVAPKSGTIFSFAANPGTIEKGDTSIVEWKTALGSKVNFNGESVEYRGSKKVTLMSTNTYMLTTDGDTKSSKTILLQVIPSGTIFSFRASGTEIGPGESATLTWQTSRMSTVKLNGKLVTEDGSMVVTPTEISTNYTLATSGDIRDSVTITINIIDVAKVNRAQNKTITASSNAADAIYANDGNYFSYWSSQANDNQWVEVDLGGVFDINKIDIYFDGVDFAKAYRLGYSTDKVNYKILKTITAGTGGLDSNPNLAISGRYFRLVLDKRATTKGFMIWEFEIYGKPSSVDVSENNSVPLNYELAQNYPNPFNPSTIISYSIPKNEHVVLKIYDLLGREVKTLVDEYKQAGKYNCEWRMENGELTSGIYFYRISAGSYSQTKKMLFIK